MVISASDESIVAVVCMISIDESSSETAMGSLQAVKESVKIAADIGRMREKRGNIGENTPLEL